MGGGGKGLGGSIAVELKVEKRHGSLSIFSAPSRAHHLVEDAAERPDVGRAADLHGLRPQDVVGAAQDGLGGHVVEGADLGGGCMGGFTSVGACCNRRFITCVCVSVACGCVHRTCHRISITPASPQHTRPHTHLRLPGDRGGVTPDGLGNTKVDQLQLPLDEEVVGGLVEFELVWLVG